MTDLKDKSTEKTKLDAKADASEVETDLVDYWKN